MDQFDWAGIVLAYCHPPLPVTLNNEQNMARWMAAENPPSDWYFLNNPLNVADFNGGSLNSFPTLFAAAIGTASVLSQLNMRPIYNALALDAPLWQFSYGCSVAPWSTGGYHGNPGFIASVTLPPSVNAPGTEVPVPEPKPISPKPKPEEEMIAPTHTGQGYWVCKPDGSIWSYGDAVYHGGMNWPNELLVSGDVITGFAAHPSLYGYWISTQMGFVYAFGEAAYHGAPTE